MTKDDIAGLGLPLELDDVTVLAVESGLEWIEQNTTLELDLTQPLPGNVKLFLVKFAGVVTADERVTSESVGGLSQSFSTETSAALIRRYASELLGGYYSAVRFVTATRRWK